MQIIFQKQTRFYGDLETVYFPIEVCTVTPKLYMLTGAQQRFLSMSLLAPNWTTATHYFMDDLLILKIEQITVTLKYCC